MIRVDVWYDYQFRTWYVTGFDAEENIIDGSEFYHYKSDAAPAARSKNCVVRIFNRYGEMMREEK